MVNPSILPYGIRLPYVLYWSMPTTAINAIGYESFTTDNIRRTTEANTQIAIPFDFHIQRIQCFVAQNGKDGSTALSFRDDLASRLSLAFAAGVTGLRTGSVADITITRGSLINMLVDTALSTNGANLEISAGTIIGYILSQDIGPVAR